MSESPSFPDRLTLIAFSTAVGIGGVNFVAVRYSNRELDPLFGAGTRFGVAALLFLVFMALRGVPFPKGRGLLAAVVYGVLAFTISYALAYWALQELSAGVAAVVFGATPLITILLAAAHRLEPLTRQGLLGAVIVVGGIVVLGNPASGAEVPVARLLAILGAALAASEASVLIKIARPVHQVATNATAMAVGAALLLIVSAATGENWVVPSEEQTWLALSYLAVLGSVGLFGLILFTLGRWTASGVAYMTPLFPVVAMVAGALIAGEAITSNGVIGGAIVLAGVYVGVLHQGTRRHKMVLEEPVPETG
ncbi:MAG: EamA family transporter [Actinomycetota bacterium]|nr:EamA family transporter [Actinomycetota bacterium]